MSNIFNEVIEKLLSGEQVFQEDDFPLHDNMQYSITRRPGILINYMSKIYLQKLSEKICGKAFGPFVIKWNIAYSKADRFKTSLENYTPIFAPKNHFFADPFVIQHENKNICFCESYNYHTGKGAIAAVELGDNGTKFLGSVIDENFHMSFPFVFIHEGKVYMVPETIEAGEIRLYECIDFPLKWEFKKILKKEISAADTILFRKNDLWYMLTNICSSGMGDYNSELHVFHSKELISDTWLPVETGNPVIFDSNKARNGGLFAIDKKLYRVNQVQANSHYGASFEINEITNISAKRYSEKYITSVRPNFKKDILSTHHLSCNEKYCLIDYAEFTKNMG